MEEFVCSFCFNVTKAEDYPKQCFCKTVQCKKCSTFLKEDDTFCYGCATIKPEISASFFRTSSFSSGYSYENWKKRNIGYNVENKDVVFEVWFDVKKGLILIKKEKEEFIEIRSLTEEESKFFKNKNSQK